MPSDSGSGSATGVVTGGEFTAEDYWAIIARRLGQAGDAAFLVIVEQLWGTYAERAVIAPRLQYLYTLRAAIDELLGGLYLEFDWKEADVSESRSQPSKQLAEMRAAVTAEIELIEMRARAARGGAVGALTAQTPVETSFPCPDPNDRAYRGDPVRRRPTRWPYC